MQLDIVTIFPDYFAPLGLSLPGKARATGLVDLRVHDLRAWTHDRHRSVDDTPYGGGPGMVMRPEPWGEAFDALAADQATVIVPSPSGIPFTQALARELATRPRLVIACGRYEGIDQRVLEEAAGRGELIEVSLGDYVLNGGEVAALAIVEAVVRLLPGFMGNPESLAEESHENGLLEYPVYTKPPTWRGLAVPAVLLSGNHAAIEGWRREQARRRTASRRPDLLHASQVRDGWVIEGAQPADAPELLTLQLACWVSEAISSGDLSQPPLHEDLAVVRAALGGWDTYVVRVEGRLVGSVRGRLDGSEWEIDRLMVAPDLRGHGLGRALLAHVMAVAPPDASSYRLVAGGASPAHLRWYKRAGFSVRRVLEDESGPVVLWQPRR